MHLVMFDIDGTLVESTAFDADCYKQAVENELKVTISDDWSVYKNVTDTGILQEILDLNNIHSHIDTVIEPVKKQFFAAIRGHLDKNGLSEIAGASGFLNSLKQKDDIKLALATGGWRHSAEMKLKAAGIDFSEIPLCSSDDHHTRIGIMQQAEQKTAYADFKSRVYFGDGVWDKKACEKLSYDFIAIGNAVEHATRYENFLNVRTSAFI